MDFSLKIGLLSLFFFFFPFFLQGYIEMKMKRNNRGVLEDFKRKQERKTSKRKERKEKKEKKEKQKKEKRKTNFFSLIEKKIIKIYENES